MNYYTRYYKSILTKGAAISPRGAETKALFDVKFSFAPGQMWRREHDNPAIGFIEGLQFIGGTHDKEAIQAVAPHVNLDLFGPMSFYGPRTLSQWPRVIQELKTDPFTRRALVTIMHPGDEPGELPCTTSMLFYRSEFSVNMIVTMRSSDAVWGLPYDIIQFSMVHQAVAAVVGLMPGGAVVNMANAHVYMDHRADGAWTEGRFDMPKFGSWPEYQEWARDLTAQHLGRKELLSVFIK